MVILLAVLIQRSVIGAVSLMMQPVVLAAELLLGAVLHLLLLIQLRLLLSIRLGCEQGNEQSADEKCHHAHQLHFRQLVLAEEESLDAKLRHWNEAKQAEAPRVGFPVENSPQCQQAKRERGARHCDLHHLLPGRPVFFFTRHVTLPACAILTDVRICQESQAL